MTTLAAVGLAPWVLVALRAGFAGIVLLVYSILQFL